MCSSYKILQETLLSGDKNEDDLIIEKLIEEKDEVEFKFNKSIPTMDLDVQYEIQRPMNWIITNIIEDKKIVDMM